MYFHIAPRFLNQRLFDSFILAQHVVSFQLHLVCLWAEPPAVQSSRSDSGKTNDFQALGLVKLLRSLAIGNVFIISQARAYSQKLILKLRF